MSVKIDETRCDDMTGRVDLARGRRARQISDRRDAIAIDRHIGADRRRSRAVDDRAVANDEIVSHTVPLIDSPTGD